VVVDVDSRKDGEDNQEEDNHNLNEAVENTVVLTHV
jgi:hypothetical protein